MVFQEESISFAPGRYVARHTLNSLKSIFSKKEGRKSADCRCPVFISAKNSAETKGD